MSAVSLTIHIEGGPYDTEGSSTAVCVEFATRNSSPQVTSVAYKTWLVVARWPTTPDEAAVVLGRMLWPAADETWLHDWRKLDPGMQARALAALQEASS